MQTTTMTTEQLIEMGFDRDQIRRLETLKTQYSAFDEQVETTQQRRRLEFLRWRYQQGEFSDIGN